jgi:hypothetical protein
VLTITADQGAPALADGVRNAEPGVVAEDVALGYKNLMEAERAFPTMKPTLDLRPVHHRLDSRIRAHVLLC